MDLGGTLCISMDREEDFAIAIAEWNNLGIGTIRSYMGVFIFQSYLTSIHAPRIQMVNLMFGRLHFEIHFKDDN